MTTTTFTSQTSVGASIGRADARTRVVGTLKYTANYLPPDVLSVAVARSTRPHARLAHVETDAARAAQGVVAVVTGAQLHDLLAEHVLTGPAFQDQPILAYDTVRYVGEPYAAVVATGRGLARAAADLIYAEYEDLEPVLDVDDAIAGPPYVHDTLRPAAVFHDLRHLVGTRDTNVCYDFHLERGNCDLAHASASHTLEADFWAAPTQHVTIELPCTLAWVEDDDRLEMITTSQTPSYVHQMLADVLSLPLNRVRVRVPPLGGGFGSKMYDRLEPLTGVLAWQLRRPVSWMLTREETFVLTTRHGAAVHFRLGADTNGQLTAAEADVRYDTGAYADVGPRITSKSGLVATGPYRTPNVRIRSRCVYTNKPSAGPFRGFGVPQVVWPHESMVDELARRIGVDPYTFRRANLLREGDISAVGTAMHSAELVGCLDQVAEALEWDRPLDPGGARFARGRGVAVGLKAVLTPTISGASFQLNQDGSGTLLINTVEMGQGSDTIMPQIAAEVLAISPERIRVVHPDTDIAPYDTITAGSRSTYHMGNAVRLAAEHVREQLLEIAARELGVPASTLRLGPGGVYSESDTTPRYTIPELFLSRFGARGTTLTGQATFQTNWAPYDHDTGQTPQATEHWFAAAAGAQVLVDRLTGRVHVEHLAVAGDVGRAINPRLCEQQLAGGALMGLGHALFDEMVFDQGQVINGTLLDYQVPSIKDMPSRLTTLVVECPHLSGPYGAKGVGETGILAVAPAIGNAIRDAVGVRLTRLPMTPERVLTALDEQTARQTQEELEMEQGADHE